MAKKVKRPLIRKLRDKYRLVILNDNTLEEVLQIRLSRLNVFAVTGFFSILLIAGVTILIAFTPLREFIPGYPDGNMRRTIVMNSIRLDSLENELALKDKYLKNINIIFSGKIPSDEAFFGDTTTSSDKLVFQRSKEDSLLRIQVEDEEKFNISGPSGSRLSSIARIHFFAPVNGVITSSFDKENNHYGIDIVAPLNEMVKSTLDGVVVFSAWTLETGHVIQIQHNDNIVSIYKHNANLLKKVGDHVKAGEVIAIIGNSGEITTGPHLHFELWQNGIALNPIDYIIF